MKRILKAIEDLINENPSQKKMVTVEIRGKLVKWDRNFAETMFHQYRKHGIDCCCIDTEN